MRPKRPVAKAQSGKLPVTIIIIVGVAIVVAFAIAMFGPYRNNDRSEQAPPDVVQIVTQNPKPAVPRPVKPITPVTPPDTASQTVRVTPPPVTPPVKPVKKPAYVGRADWHVYHRPTCKYAQRIKPDNLVSFSSASEARAANYVPCRICKPPAEKQVASSTSGSRVTPKTQPRTVKRPKPVTFKTVAVTFPYKVGKRDVRNEDGIHRIDYTIDVERPLNRNEALSLAKSLVTRETSKHALNAMSFVIRRTVIRNKPKWVIWIDWAPYGSITDAGHIEAGDYRTHQFYIVLEGVQ